MQMKKLRCDKPYDIDEARKKRELPRRRRKDSRTTAYELTIRVPSEYRVGCQRATSNGIGHRNSTVLRSADSTGSSSPKSIEANGVLMCMEGTCAVVRACHLM